MNLFIEKIFYLEQYPLFALIPLGMANRGVLMIMPPFPALLSIPPRYQICNLPPFFRAVLMGPLDYNIILILDPDFLFYPEIIFLLQAVRITIGLISYKVTPPIKHIKILARPHIKASYTNLFDYFIYLPLTFILHLSPLPPHLTFPKSSL